MIKSALRPTIETAVLLRLADSMRTVTTVDICSYDGKRNSICLWILISVANITSRSVVSIHSSLLFLNLILYRLTQHLKLVNLKIFKLS